jgi:hypothetical protein
MMMKQLTLVVLLAACGGNKEAGSQSKAAPTAGSSVPAATHAEADPPDSRCAAFADRVAECAAEGPIKAARSEEEKKSVRDVAYAVCTKTTDDAAALHYYGDVERKIACMQGKDCAGVSACLAGDVPSDGSPSSH